MSSDRDFKADETSLNNLHLVDKIKVKQTGTFRLTALSRCCLTDVFTDEQERASVYKPRQRQNVFQAASHPHADKGWGVGVCGGVHFRLWPPSSRSSKNTFRAESGDAWLFRYLLFLPSLCSLWNIQSGADLTGFYWKSRILQKHCRSNFQFHVQSCSDSSKCGCSKPFEPSSLLLILKDKHLS